MNELPNITTNEHIYSSWENNKFRVDLPFFGPEYRSWVENTPLDVQKIVQDYYIARKIHKNKRGEDSNAGKLSAEAYPEHRARAIREAEIVADTVFAFFKEKHPDLFPELLAVGLDGSSLYQPRVGGDIDVWIMCREVTPQIHEALMEYYEQVQAPQAEKELVEVRPASLYQSPAGKEIGSIPTLAVPHKIVRFINLTEEEYLQAVQVAIDDTRESKAALYKRARFFAKK
jgi:hypothetical protein